MTKTDITMARAKRLVPMDGRLCPIEQPQKHLIESLQWHLHSEGVGFAVSGLIPANQAGRFKQLVCGPVYRYMRNVRI